MESKEPKDTVLSGQLRNVFFAITNALRLFAGAGRWGDTYIFLNAVSQWTEERRKAIREQLLSRREKSSWETYEGTVKVQTREAKAPSLEALKPILERYKVSEDQVTETVVTKQLSVAKLEDLIERGFIPRKVVEDEKTVSHALTVVNTASTLNELENEFAINAKKTNIPPEMLVNMTADETKKRYSDVGGED